MLDAIPAEMITMGAGAAMGAFVKMQAQKQADLVQVAKLGFEANRQQGDLTQEARQGLTGGGAWVRRIVILIIISVAFGGLIYAAVAKQPVSFMYVTEVKSHFLGLFETGGKLKTATAEGFVLPPYVAHQVSGIGGFLFGAGAAKIAK